MEENAEETFDMTTQTSLSKSAVDPQHGGPDGGKKKVGLNSNC